MPEDDRLTGRLRRYAQVGTAVGGVAARMVGQRYLGFEADRTKNAQELTRALGGLKGPLMKVAQILSTIPEALPQEYVAELSQLQANAPPMGWPFVRRRMVAELGPDWAQKFGSFERESSAAASLGQVHKATAKDGRPLAAKLQYPDMQSAVEADLGQLRLIFSIHRRMDPAIDTAHVFEEIAARLREELDYGREAQHMALYRAILADTPEIRVPDVLPDLSTRRLLTMTWLKGTPMLEHKGAALEVRNALARAMFLAWWQPFTGHAVIHGDPHLGNYTVASAEPDGATINLLDYGCIRIFPPRFVGGVVDLYRALQSGDEALAVHAYETWGFRNLSRDLIETLNIWAGFIYGPLLDNRTRSIADGVRPGEYGRDAAMKVHARLKELGPVRPPREFVFMDRAAIGLGGVFLHLDAQLNWHDLFNERLEGFSTDAVAARQAEALQAVGLPPPA
ncbi:ABC1 kinase family protein [Zavarzinia sp. CC-PAN008]|uniref:ABC1 kinase family protein n=1 Tax=Zavarzinia sp. CC-PAN008 TaxID=3243332 RepID=UPI003F743B9B